MLLKIFWASEAGMPRNKYSEWKQRRLFMEKKNANFFSMPTTGQDSSEEIDWTNPTKVAEWSAASTRLRLELNQRGESSITK
jgi:hypothetical protein